MTEFTIELAGRAYFVCCTFESTKAYCKRYLTAKPADYKTVITLEDIAAERRQATQKDADDGAAYSDAYLETLALLRKLAEYAPNFDAFLMHGSAIMVDNKAYLFTAPSGTGKSTHAGLWRQMLADRAIMINDDKPFIRKDMNGFSACGTPWNGKHKLGSPICAPLAGICILEQAKENEISRLTAGDALNRLMMQCYMPKNSIAALKTLEMLDVLLKQVPVYLLRCNISREAARLSYSVMTE